MALRCRHCGTPNPDQGDICPNCDQNPDELNKDETFPFNPSSFLPSSAKIQNKKKILKRKTSPEQNP